MINSNTIGGDGPYRQGAQRYVELGWVGVIPSHHGDASVPSGTTGFDGKDPSARQVDSWMLTRAGWNLGLRLPVNLVVVDVDCYDGKNGCARLAQLERELGPLPPTWSSTSRQDGSRKLFFTTTHRGKWHDAGDGIEILHHGWRYARVWPSINPKTGAPERWYDPTETLSEDPPTPTVFPAIPASWEARFGGEREIVASVELGDGKFPWNELLVAERIPWGDQDNLLTRAARSCRATNDSDAVALLKLTTLVNKFVENPDSPKGEWTQEHVVRKWNDVKTKHAAGRSFDDDFAPWMLEVVKELPDSLRDELLRESNRREARRILDERAAAEARGPRPRKTFAELLVEPRVEHVLPQRLAAELNILGGPSQSGKSLLARDWAIEVANSGRNVLWVASEGMHDVQERFGAHPGWTDETAQRLLYLDPINVGSETEVAWLLNEYRDDRVALVVFDLIYDMGMRGENSMEDVGPIIGNLKRISAQWTAATLAIGHSGHNGERRFRGHSSWQQRAYVEWHMANGVLTCEKSKIAHPPSLTRHYELSYPALRWIDPQDVVTTALGRQQAIARDLDENPDDNDSARAQRLHQQLGTTVEYARKLIATIRRGQ